MEQGQAPFRRMRELIRANSARQHYFFHPQTMAFFHSRIESRLYKGRWFITSESPEFFGPRYFNVRKASDDASIWSAAGPFTTLAEADKVMRRMAAAEAKG